MIRHCVLRYSKNVSSSAAVAGGGGVKCKEFQMVQQTKYCATDA